MTIELARDLMIEFAEATGVASSRAPKRYLWTDAFAVCNFLELHRRTGDERFRQLGLSLVEQVHQVLGRHRKDDPRQGWISGLSDREGQRHPTVGGLRIGKPLNERGADEPVDRQREWEQDGQYFHYLTRWMHALERTACETGQSDFGRWAVELAATAHNAFTYETAAGRPKRMVWKMSIDLTRPLVPTMGHHDPLDALITYLELQTSERLQEWDGPDLSVAVAEATRMCDDGDWQTDDPLGIGGLLDAASRLAQIVFRRGERRRPLLHRLLVEAEASLQAVVRSRQFQLPASRRLAFRELGMAIGILGLEAVRDVLVPDQELSALVDELMAYREHAERIVNFWADADRRASSSWRAHADINNVMLASSLVPAAIVRM